MFKVNQKRINAGAGEIRGWHCTLLIPTAPIESQTLPEMIPEHKAKRKHWAYPDVAKQTTKDL